MDGQIANYRFFARLNHARHPAVIPEMVHTGAVIMATVPLSGLNNAEEQAFWPLAVGAAAIRQNWQPARPLAEQAGFAEVNLNVGCPKRSGYRTT